jgi:hypothetical protein
MRASTIATLLVALGVTAAPAVAGQQGPPPNRDVDPGITDGSLQRELNKARERWRAGGLRSYSYRLQLSCFCSTDATRPRNFVVRRGRPQSPPKGFRDVATVPRLFKLIQREIDRKADGLDVEYRANGSPKVIAVDPISNAIDDEYTYYIRRFRPPPAGG